MVRSPQRSRVRRIHAARRIAARAPRHVLGSWLRGLSLVLALEVTSCFVAAVATRAPMNSVSPLTPRSIQNLRAEQHRSSRPCSRFTDDRIEYTEGEFVRAIERRALV